MRTSRTTVSIVLALGRRSNFPQAHLQLGRLLKENGRMAAAEQHWREVLQIKPDLAEAQQELARMQGEEK